MQMQLPFFPTTTKLINPCVGVFKKDEYVYYMHNGQPLFCHHASDKKSYRYITANMVETGLCTATDIAKALGVSARNIQLYAKSLREKGSSWFFNRVETRGACYKMDEAAFFKAQELLDLGKTNREIGRALGITDSAIAYHIRQGKLKKKKL